MKATLLDESTTAALGRRGEELAAEFLERKGFRLVAANFVAPVGRNRRGAQILAEIDLIAYDGETLVFVEVKTRRSDEFAVPESAVNLRKQRNISRAARVYRRIFQLNHTPFRFDVVSVLMSEALVKPKIELLSNFWTLSKFRKSFWSDGSSDL